MKTPIIALLSIAAIAFSGGCASQTTQTPAQAAQTQATEQLAVNLFQSVQNGAATYYGVPANDTKALNLAENSLWGAYIQIRNGQPIDNASTVTAINNILADVVPAGTSNAQLLSALQAAATIPKPAVPSAQRGLPTLYYGDQIVKGAVLKDGAQIVYSVPQ